MCTDLVTTRSLPFGFRSVNRKLQLRLVCNEHNGDGSRVKVGQLERGKRTSERRQGDKKRHALRAILLLFSNGEKSKEETDRSTAADRMRNRTKINRLWDSSRCRTWRERNQSSGCVSLQRAVQYACLVNLHLLPLATSHPFVINAPPLSSHFRRNDGLTLVSHADGIHYNVTGRR